MLSIGLTLVVLMGLAFAVAALAARRGTTFSFGSLCWVPLAALIFAVVRQQSLGYAVIAVIFVSAFMSLALVGYGIALTIGALRQGSASARNLIIGTVVAGMPLFVLAALWLIPSLRAR